jgi:hypothetical protein
MARRTRSCRRHKVDVASVLADSRVAHDGHTLPFQESRGRFCVHAKLAVGAARFAGRLKVQSGCCTNDAAISVEEFRALMQETRRALGKQLEVLNTMRVRVGEKPLVLVERRAAA